MAVLSVSAQSFAADPDLEALIVSDVPDGYSLSTDPNALSGPYTMEELIAASGQDLGDVPVGAFSGLSLHARTWTRRATDRIIVLLLKAPNESDASDFLAGSVFQGNRTAQTFDPLVTGAAGFVAEVDGYFNHVVVWQQGTYGVQVATGSLDSAQGEAAAREVARKQADLLEQSLGIGVTLEPSDTDIFGFNDDGDDTGSVTSPTVRIGQALAAVVAIAVIIGVVWFFVNKARADGAEAEWTLPSEHVPPPPLAPPTPTGSPSPGWQPNLPPRPPPGPFDSPPA